VIVFIISFAILALAFTSISAMNSRDEIRKLEQTVLLANSSVREFIITRDPAHAKRTELLLMESDKILRTKVDTEGFNQIHTELSMYLHSISNLIEVYTERGFYEEVGVEGALRTNMMVVESHLRRANDQRGLAMVLDTRRAEKNYLLRMREEYRMQVHAGIDDIQTHIEGMPSLNNSDVSSRIPDRTCRVD
jgi:hypothetical protein